MNCKTCNFSLVEGQMTCPVCGTPANEMTNSNEQNTVEQMKEVVVGNVPMESSPTPDNIEEGVTAPDNSMPLETDVFGFNDNSIEEQNNDVVLDTPNEVPVPEPMVETPMEAPVPESVMETPMPEPMVETPMEVPVPEPVMETPMPEPMVETPMEAPVPETSMETPMPEPVAETPMEAPMPEPVMETPMPEPVVETPMEAPVLEPVMETPIEAPTLNQEEVKNLENSIMPDNNPVAPVSLQPLPMEENVATPAPKANEPMMEAPKKAAKKLGMIPMAIIGVFIVLAAAAAGFFGFRYFFKQNQSAEFNGYKYLISGKYNAVLNDKNLIVSEQKDTTKSAWNMTFSAYSNPTMDYESILHEKEELKLQYEEEYEVEKIDQKNIKDKDMLIYETKKDEKSGYMIITTNKDKQPLVVEITFPSSTRDEKVLEILTEIVNTSEK